MYSPQGGWHTVRIAQLRVGLYIKLDRWLGHPFLFSSFKIKDQKQIDAHKSMGLAEVEYLPGRSDTEPLPHSADAAYAADASVLDELMHEKKERIDTLHKERERIQAAEKKYVKTAITVKNVMRLAGSHPAQAAAQSGEIADVFRGGQNPYIHLMGDNLADENAYFHSLNVSVLAPILARAVGIGDREVMRGDAIDQAARSRPLPARTVQNDYPTGA